MKISYLFDFEWKIGKFRPMFCTYLVQIIHMHYF